jgi:hypothetical protein
MTVSEISVHQHQNGTYASLKLTTQTAQQLADWCDQQGIPHDPAEEFHCTLCYSRTPLPQAVAIQKSVSIKAKISEWKNLGDHACTVLINCPDAHKIFKLLEKHGASHDWPEYTPHVTVNSTQHLNPLPTVTPDFELEFDHIEVKPLEV